jgi:hypothetical protein
MGSKKRISEMRKILSNLGFKNEKIQLECYVDKDTRAMILDYQATDEAIEDAYKALKFIKVERIKK